MPNQSKNNEEIAAKAGINIVYPGKYIYGNNKQ
jgi:hypothetical protein